MASNYMKTARKLQIAINKKFKVRILFNTTQWYSDKKQDSINLYTVKRTDGDADKHQYVNTDIFSTLTAEEQAIKIKELKKQYNDMYIYIDDLIDKIGDINIDEDNAETIERISKNLYRLREYLQQYITTTFNQKDYFDNDVFFRRFLYVLYSINTTIEEFVKGRNKKIGLDDTESEKK